MNERIIVVPSANKLSLALAYHDVNVFNVRIVTPIELSDLIITRQALITDKSFINKDEELAYFVKAIKGNSYFKSLKINDINKIRNAINDLRQLVIDDELFTLKINLGKGIFEEKNKALYEVYKNYIDLLSEDNKIDTIGLIRFVIDNCESINSEVNIIRELPLTNLAKELVNKCSSNYREISLNDLFAVDNKKLKINAYKNCYGASNEVASAISDIYRDSKLDNCNIALADVKTYSQIIYDYVVKYQIPASFGCGIPITNSYPGRLLQLYNNWANVDNYSFESFFELISSSYFDSDELERLIDIDNKRGFNVSKFWDSLAHLRLTNNREINRKRISDFEDAIKRDINDNNSLIKYVDSFKLLEKELTLPLADFIDKYAVIRKDNKLVNKLDISSKNTIINYLNSVASAGIEISNDVIEDVLNKNVCRQTSEPGKLYITSINEAITSLRNELYVLGLSSLVYPGPVKENPLILDSDLRIFNDDTLTSIGKVDSKKNELYYLVQLASNLNNKIYLSYPGLNVSELKNNNASSLLYELYKLEKDNNNNLDDFKNEIKNVGYFEPLLSNTTNIGIAYNEEIKIKYEPVISDTYKTTSLSLKRYSPSALNTYFNCHKAFLYQYLLRVPEPDDYNPYEIISASDSGTLAHSLMQYLSSNWMDKDKFLDLAKDVFDEFLKIKVPLVTDVEKERENFVHMMANGWGMDNKYHRQVLVSEKDLETKHPVGIIIHGYPDRVEIDENGKAIIVDFKTGRNIEHIKDDLDTCLQTIIYAYIIEDQLGYKVDHCEYRYLRKNKIITCEYNDTVKNKLNEKLLAFKQAIDIGDFDISAMSLEEEKQKCKYCKYGLICGKEIKV